MGKASRKKRGTRTKPDVIRLPKEVVDALQEQQKLFAEKFGRKPGADDPIFFDPSKDTPQPMDDVAVGEAIAEAMSQAGIAPEYIYASRKTGLMPSTENEHLLSDADLEEWDTAIAEYHEIISKKPQ